MKITRRFILNVAAFTLTMVFAAALMPLWLPPLLIKPALIQPTADKIMNSMMALAAKQMFKGRIGVPK